MMTIEMRTCVGYGPQGPHDLSNINFRNSGGPGKVSLRTQCRDCEALTPNGREGEIRNEESRGVYLAGMKVIGAPSLVKIGKSGDGTSGFRSRAGRLAGEARVKLINVQHAEIFHVIEIEDAEERAEWEGMLLDLATPVYGREYFDIRDYPRFSLYFSEYGRRYTERSTYAERWAEFAEELYRGLR